MQTGEDKVLRRKVGNLSVEFFDPLLTACGTVLQLFELADERAEQIFSVGAQLPYHKVECDVYFLLSDSAPSAIRLSRGFSGAYPIGCAFLSSDGGSCGRIRDSEVFWTADRFYSFAYSLAVGFLISACTAS